MLKVLGVNAHLFTSSTVFVCLFCLYCLSLGSNLNVDVVAKKTFYRLREQVCFVFSKAQPQVQALDT